MEREKIADAAGNLLKSSRPSDGVIYRLGTSAKAPLSLSLSHSHSLTLILQRAVVPTLCRRRTRRVPAAN